MSKLDESKQSIIRSFKYAQEHHRNMQRRYDSIFKNMCTRQSRDIYNMNAKLDDKDNQIKEREAVVQQLLDANEKLEVALKATTKAAEDALKAKRQVRNDLRKLKSKHLRDIVKRTRMHENTIEDLKGNLSRKVSDLNELEATKADLVAKLQAKERELDHEVRTRQELYASTYDVDSAKKLLFEGAARVNASKARSSSRTRRESKRLPPSSKQIIVENECSWLQEQVLDTIAKIVRAKSAIESIEANVNESGKSAVIGKSDSSGQASRPNLRTPLGEHNHILM